MRRDATDPVPDPGDRGLGPARARVRVGRARPSWVSREVAILIGAAMIGLAWLSTLDSGRAPARMRWARGEGDPRGRVTALALAFSPDGTTIATIHTDGRVALRDPSEGRGLRFLGYRGYACALAFSPDGRHLALGGFGPDITLCDLETEGAEDPLKMPIPDATALAFSSDGRILAAASRLTDRILLWDVAAPGNGPACAATHPRPSVSRSRPTADRSPREVVSETRPSSSGISPPAAGDCGWRRRGSSRRWRTPRMGPCSPRLTASMVPSASGTPPRAAWFARSAVAPPPGIRWPSPRAAGCWPRPRTTAR